MTKNAAKKNAARAYQAAHPGTNFTAALRAVEHTAPPNDWAPGQVPWIRTIDRTPITCYLCGKTTMITSFGDSGDRGRVQLYCDNGQCEAREVEVIVLRDGTAATSNRADVQVLVGIAAAAHHRTELPDAGNSWIAGAVPWARSAPGPQLCVFCGQTQCIRSRGDVAADTGRIQLYCDNDRCEAREVELIVMRDGTVETLKRPDVEALRAIDEPPALRQSDKPMFRTAGEWIDLFDGDDPLSRRL